MIPRQVRHVSLAALFTWLLLFIPLSTVSCSRAVSRQDHGMQGSTYKHGPPPHAPAHGYRHKHERDDVELVFDSRRGVYLVVGIPGCYFFDGVYYRRASQQWQMTFTLSGVWKSIADNEVPKGLRSEAFGDESSDDKPGKSKGKAWK